jgi:hypothetical protein
LSLCGAPASTRRGAIWQRWQRRGEGSHQQGHVLAPIEPGDVEQVWSDDVPTRFKQCANTVDVIRRREHWVHARRRDDDPLLRDSQHVDDFLRGGVGRCEHDACPSHGVPHEGEVQPHGARRTVLGQDKRDHIVNRHHEWNRCPNRSAEGRDMEQVGVPCLYRSDDLDARYVPDKPPWPIAEIPKHFGLPQRRHAGIVHACERG